jgi:hypothetical protein
MDTVDEFSIIAGNATQGCINIEPIKTQVLAKQRLDRINSGNLYRKSGSLAGIGKNSRKLGMSLKNT